MKLDEGWNQIHFNLTDFTRRAYGTNYLETLRVQIHANCRIRRIYFTDQLLSSKSIPAEYRAFSNAQEDNAEDQYQNQLNNDPNQMQGEGEEQIIASVTMKKEVADKMTEISKENPKEWKFRDLDLFQEAVERLKAEKK